MIEELRLHAQRGKRSQFLALSRMTLVALCVVLGLIAVESTRLGISGLIAELAQRDADRWSTLPKPPSMSEHNRIAGYYSDSLAYAPSNPWALEGLGVQDLERMRQSTVPRNALAFTQDARVKFREALTQRPASPFLWSNLALTKLYLDEVDEEFFRALRLADALGPWEPTAQLVVLFAGLGAWQKLDPTLQAMLAGVIRRGAARNGKKMFEIVKNYRRFDLVCPLSGYHAIAGADCPKSADAGASIQPTKRGYR